MSLGGAWRRTIVPALGAAAVVCAVSACSGRDELRCEDQGEYAASTSAPPVRVPEGLNVPEAADALTIPPAGSAAPADEDGAQGCLERPPDYFEGGGPGGAGQ